MLRHRRTTGGSVFRTAAPAAAQTAGIENHSQSPATPGRGRWDGKLNPRLQDLPPIGGGRGPGPRAGLSDLPPSGGPTGGGAHPTRIEPGRIHCSSGGAGTSGNLVAAGLNARESKSPGGLEQLKENRHKNETAAGRQTGEALACQYKNKSPQFGAQGVSGGARTLLRSVRACEERSWSIITWSKADPSNKRTVPFRCKSWRHEGDCRRWKGAQDFVRVRDAIRSRPGGSWLYLVLTFDPSEYQDEFAAYRAGLDCWGRLAKRIARQWGELAYVQTWEKHKSGWPHVNVLLWCPLMAAAVDGDGWKSIRANWLGPAAVASGFGLRVWLEPMKNADAMAGYVSKLSRELTGAGVKDQVPVNAPRHFRRLRASRRLLPPPFKRQDITGVLVAHPAPMIVLDTDTYRNDYRLYFRAGLAAHDITEFPPTAATLNFELISNMVGIPLSGLDFPPTFGYFPPTAAAPCSRGAP